MKKRIVCLLLVLLFCFPFPITAEESEKGNYLALGDSITEGYGLWDPDSEGFAALASEGLGLALQNESVSGSTAQDVLTLLQSGELDSAIAEAALITITCGGNDLINTLYQAIAEGYNTAFATNYTAREVERALMGKNDVLTAEDLLPTATAILPTFPYTAEFSQALAQYEAYMFAEDGVIDYLRSFNQTADIFVLTQYNPYATFGGVYGVIKYSMDAGARRLNKVIVDNAARGDYTVADVYAAFSKRKDPLCNANTEGARLELDFHPNAAGHELIAEVVENTYVSGDFSLIGYQSGTNSLRIVGSCPHLQYDRMELTALVDGKETVLTATTAYKTLYGTVADSRRAVLTETQRWLYCFALDFPTAGEYEVRLLPKAICGNTAWYAEEKILRVTVQENGDITVK